MSMHIHRYAKLQLDGQWQVNAAAAVLVRGWVRAREGMPGDDRVHAASASRGDHHGQAHCTPYTQHLAAENPSCASLPRTLFDEFFVRVPLDVCEQD
jgi:hypothetical protein